MRVNYRTNWAGPCIQKKNRQPNKNMTVSGAVSLTLVGSQILNKRAVMLGIKGQIECNSTNVAKPACRFICLTMMHFC